MRQDGRTGGQHQQRQDGVTDHRALLSVQRKRFLRNAGNRWKWWCDADRGRCRLRHRGFLDQFTHRSGLRFSLARRRFRRPRLAVASSVLDRWLNPLSRSHWRQRGRRFNGLRGRRVYGRRRLRARFGLANHKSKSQKRCRKGESHQGFAQGTARCAPVDSSLWLRELANERDYSRDTGP